MTAEITIDKRNDYRFAPIKQIRETTPEKIFEGFISLVLQVYSVVGQRITAGDAKSLASGLAEDCGKRYCSLSMADVSKALNDGARGVYGEFVTPSLKLFNEWLRLYRQTCVPVVAVSTVDESRMLPPIGHEELMKQQVQIMKLWYEKHGTLDNFYAPPIFIGVYKWLEDTGEFTLNNESKKEIFDSAKKHIFSKMQLNAASRSEQKEAKRLSDIVRGIAAPTGNDEQKINKLVKRECYRVCIEKYLKSI